MVNDNALVALSRRNRSAGGTRFRPTSASTAAGWRHPLTHCAAPGFSGLTTMVALRL